MEVYDDDILFRRVKTTNPDHYRDGKLGLLAFGLRKLKERRVDAGTGQPIDGKEGKYEGGYSVNVARLSSIAETLGAGANDFIVVGFRVREVREAGFSVAPDEVKAGHPSYAGLGSENPSHALVIGAGEVVLFEQKGKEALAQCCYLVEQATGELLGKIELDV